MLLTVEDVRAKVREISEARGDDEIAHGLEDELRERVLKAIAGGAPNAAELAAEVLKTSDIEFQRWCA